MDAAARRLDPEGVRGGKEAVVRDAEDTAPPKLVSRSIPPIVSGSDPGTPRREVEEPWCLLAHPKVRLAPRSEIFIKRCDWVRDNSTHTHRGEPAPNQTKTLATPRSGRPWNQASALVCNKDSFEHQVAGLVRTFVLFLFSMQM